ncbi:Major facilitator superfamily protein [Azotobacter vinelandii CA]|uniref:Major facilitator superfamily protein n=2 Tax=Azotobacter vinelandii TaxID=354 RepID=C1DNC1_AZOVD|nr:aromatic acid/H+ symport family MFS transporter [Azotobacter vinelandii]ACO79288.1 Major facilitator superfamily protein [Azotobacter vinelandii DJ]AGK14742.1 Major facilitator superfamily protein [Azotobacter vinelandii CA]AGK21095.1 Major facilitator superfamily protein [Azotobacter vinelandii CA6]SFY25738.1 MFS transporter, AAHS family, 4-hydroxybenzoate transporter [Azotobacter vinelandii]GLK58632.1 MFS transporter [Azotobacter vinelandii]
MHTDSPVEVKHWIDGQPLCRRQWLILALCFFIVLFDGMDVAVMGFIAPALMQDWQLSKAAFGPVMSATMVGLALGALVAGPYADRFGRRKVLLGAVTVFGILSLASAFARNPYELAILRFLTGVGLGAAMPNTTTLLSEYLPERYRSLLITVMFTGFNLGSGGAGFVAAWVIPQYGWHGVLLVGGLLPLALLPLLWLFLPESARFLVANNAPAERIAKLLNKLGGQFGPATRFVTAEQPVRHKAPVRRLFSEQYRLGTFALWVTYFMGLLVIYLTMGWLPTLIRESGISIERAATVTGLFQIGGTVGAIAVGWIMDRHSPNRVIATAYALGGAFILLLGVLGLESELLTVGVLAAGFCISGAQTGLNAFAPGYYPTESRATGVSWMLGIGRFGAIFGAMIGGLILSLGLGFGLIFGALAIPAFIAALAILLNGYASRRLPRTALAL